MRGDNNKSYWDMTTEELIQAESRFDMSPRALYNNMLLNYNDSQTRDIMYTRSRVRRAIKEAMQDGESSLEIEHTGDGTFDFFMNSLEAQKWAFIEVIIPELLSSGFSVTTYQSRWFFGLFPGKTYTRISWDKESLYG